MVLDLQTSAKISHYRPLQAPPVWEEIAPLVRSVVAASVTAVPYDVQRLLHVTAHLALWAEQSGLERSPEVWLRNEVIDAFVLSRAGELGSTSVMTYRTWLLRVRDALAWTERGEATPARLHGKASPHPPYTARELAGLRHWAMHLPGQQRTDALALLALGAGLGLTPGEVVASRGRDLQRIGAGGPVRHTGIIRTVPVVARAAWEWPLADLASAGGGRFLFRPRRTSAQAKNLIGSWTHRHRPPGALPRLSAGRLRATWIVALLATRLDHDLVARAAGLASSASLARYQHHIPPLEEPEAMRLLRGEGDGAPHWPGR